MCHQTAGLIARTLEENNISTVMISLLKEVTEKIRPPRVLEVPFDLGFPLGEPQNIKLQHSVIETCLTMVQEVKEPESWWQFDK